MTYDERGKVSDLIIYDISGKVIPGYVTVTEVLPDSNGAKYGIRNGDVFILYDGQPVETTESFIQNRSKETGEDPHDLVILRDNEFITIQIRPGSLGSKLKPIPLLKEQQKLINEKLKEVKY